jgi:hypothetical protein
MVVWQSSQNDSMGDRLKVLLRNCFLFPRMGEKANITTEAQLAEPQPNTNITTETRRHGDTEKTF